MCNWPSHPPTYGPVIEVDWCVLMLCYYSTTYLGKRETGYTVLWYQLEGGWSSCRICSLSSWGQKLSAGFLSTFKLVPENCVSYMLLPAEKPSLQERCRLIKWPLQKGPLYQWVWDSPFACRVACGASGSKLHKSTSRNLEWLQIICIIMLAVMTSLPVMLFLVQLTNVRKEHRNSKCTGLKKWDLN